MCQILMSDDAVISYPKLVLKLNEMDDAKCTDQSYDSMIEELKDESPNAPGAASRSWTWQTCNEFGYFQTAGENSIFSQKYITLEFFEKICADAYGVDAEHIRNAITATNECYGGLTPKATNIVFTNGDVDPWHKLGITVSSDTMPAVLVSGTAHCADLYASSPEDLVGLKNARNVQYRFLYPLLKAL